MTVTWRRSAVSWGRGPIAGRVQQIASYPINVIFPDPLIGGFDDLRSLGEAIEALDRLSEPGVGLGKPREYPWRL